MHLTDFLPAVWAAACRDLCFPGNLPPPPPDPRGIWQGGAFCQVWKRGEGPWPPRCPAYRVRPLFLENGNRSVQIVCLLFWEAMTQEPRWRWQQAGSRSPARLEVRPCTCPRLAGLVIYALGSQVLGARGRLLCEVCLPLTPSWGSVLSLAYGPSQPHSSSGGPPGCRPSRGFHCMWCPPLWPL